MLKLNRKHSTAILLCCFSVFLITLYSWFNWAVLKPLSQEFNYQYIFNWPDAMANSHFVNQFIQSGSFVQSEPLNAILNDIVRPRSVNIVNHNIVPAGFLGILILYGWLGLFFTKYSVIYFTPIIATLGVLVFYLLIKDIFDKRIGLIAAGLLAFLAPYVFFANQTMLATVPFLVILLYGFHCLFKSAQYESRKKSNLIISWAGFLFGLAISIRYQEAPWILLSLLIIWLSQRKTIKLEKVLLFAGGLFIPLILILLYNHQTYNAWFTVGYLRMNNPASAISERLPAEIAVAYQNSILAYLKLILLPFGFSVSNIYHNFVTYLWLPFRGHLIFVFIGLVIWLKNIRQSSKAQKLYVVCAALSGAFLIIYYGSWVFVDRMVLQNNTISSSYTRYWLPLIVMTLPLLAYFIDWIFARFSKKHYFVNSAILFFFGAYLIISFSTAFYAQGDGLYAQAAVTREYYVRAQKVAEKVEPNSIIVVEREDKLFFPTFKVVTFEQDFSVFSELSKIVSETPIYYLSVNTDKDIDFLNKNKLKTYSVRWELVQEIDAPFRLFKLKTLGD